MSSAYIPDNVKAPTEALHYCPPPNIIFFGKGKSAQRFIFRDQEISEFENDKLSRLELELKKSNINIYQLHPTWDRKEVLRFCYGTGWKTRTAKEVVIKYIKWKQTIMPQGYLSLYPRVSKILETGCIYIHGRDSHYRPIMVINFNRFNVKKFLIQEYIYMIAFILDFVIENMLLPGRVENWVVISDFEKNGFGELGFGSLKQVMGILTDNYRCRLGCNYVVNPAKIVYYMWSCMKPFLDDVLIEKVKILNKPHPEELFSHCNLYQVEEKYGGKAPNAHIFWPPIMPKAPYTIDGKYLHSVEEIANKSFESQENLVEESEFSPKRRSLSINGAFEVKVEYAKIPEKVNEKLKSKKKTKKALEIPKYLEEIKENTVEIPEYIEEIKENTVEIQEENDKKLRKERRKLRKLKRETKKKKKEIEEAEEQEIRDYTDYNENEVILEKKDEKVQLMSERDNIESEYENLSKSPVGVYIKVDGEGTSFETSKTDVGCGICTTIPALPKIRACLLF